MKKVFKIIGAILLSLGVIALIVCLCVIPNETKAFFDVVVEYLDKPIVLCGVSVTIGGVLLFFITRYIIANTSFGKKKLNDLNDKIIANGKISKEQYEELTTLITNNKKSDDDKFNKIDNTLNTLNNAVLLIPNKKVQEALNNGNETKDN